MVRVKEKEREKESKDVVLAVEVPQSENSEKSQHNAIITDVIPEENEPTTGI